MSSSSSAPGAASSVRTASIKVPGGKLVRLRGVIDGESGTADIASNPGKLLQPQLSGDFFVMPQEKFVFIERFLTGWSYAMPNGEEQLRRRLEKFLGREQITLSGFDVATLARLVYLLREESKESV